MRKLLVVAAALLAMCVGCTDSGPDPQPSPETELTLASLDLDWPRSSGSLDPGERPPTPDGFEDAQLDEMATVLSAWATAASVDDSVWASSEPVDAVTAVLPDRLGVTLREQIGAVSPRLAVGNVFGDDVRVVGAPVVTTAWRIATEEDEQGERFVRLELQTRTAYEVQQPDGPIRVIGVLRLHSLSAYPETTDDYGVSTGWQEFGAGGCALALDDALVPDDDLDETVEDLRTFVEVGNGDDVVMPELESDEQVDDAYLDRCRRGSV